MKKRLFQFFAFALFALTLQGLPALAAETSPGTTEGNSIAVLQAFDQQQAQHDNNQSTISAHQKQVIMFLMGVPLLLLILLTAAVGIAMGIFGKPWFLTHMILASLTISLALAHVVIGLVWFYPF